MNTANIFGEEEKQVDGLDKFRSETTNGSEAGKNGTSDTSGQSSLIPPEKPELIPVEPVKDITDYLLEDEILADSLNSVIQGGTKEISDGEGGSIIVPDYHLRLKGIDMSLKLKGHYREKRVKSGLVDAIYQLK